MNRNPMAANALEVERKPEGTDGGEALPARGPLSARVCLIALWLVPLNAWWLIEIEYVRYTDNFTVLAIFMNAVALLLGLIAVNQLLRRLRPAWMFSRQEIAALYIIVTVATGLGGHDQLQILFSTLTYLGYHAQQGTGWATELLSQTPGHLLVTDREAVAPLFTGNSTLYRWDHIRPWLGPLGWWTLFVLLFAWTTLCLITLFRRQWEEERLSYPIATIPITVLREERALFRAPLLWAGLGIGAFCQFSSLLHTLFPSIPGVQTGVQVYPIETAPWSAAGPLLVSWFPFAFGLTFLLPTQLSFSCWFFFLASRLELVAAASFGHTEWGRFPYVDQQGTGAVFGIFLTILWASRRHLASVWRSAFSLSRGPGAGGSHPPIQDPKSSSQHQDAEEALSYRTALFGLIGGAAALTAFLVAAGMRWQTALFYLGILFVVLLVLGRIRADLGLPTFALGLTGGDQVMQRVAGTEAWTRNDLTVMTLFFWITRTHRQLPALVQVDALQIGRKTGAPLRTMPALVLGASALGAICAFWALLHCMYQTGFHSARFQGPGLLHFGDAPWQTLNGWLSFPRKPDGGTMGAYLFGAGFTLFLYAMQVRFIGWPFHPVGYLVSTSFGVFRLGVPLFLSWLIKTLLLRYGGLPAYRRALPFFIGLVLGEFSAAMLRTLLLLALDLNLPPMSGLGGL